MRDDIRKALAEYEINTFGQKKQLERAETQLDPDEIVKFIVPTVVTVSSANTRKKDKNAGVVVLTDKRVLITSQIAFNHSSETVLFHEIRSVNSGGDGVSGGHIELHTLTKTITFIVTYKKDMVRRIAQAFEAVAGSPSAPAAPQADVLAQIEKLSELKEKGILTEDEFKAKKDELLARL